MKASLFALGLLMCVISSGGVAAPLMNGNELHRFCTRNRDAAYAYIAGWLDKRATDHMLARMPLIIDPANRWAKSQADAVNGSFCIPDRATIGQVIDIVCTFAAEHPGTRHQGANWHIDEALSRVWACKK